MKKGLLISLMFLVTFGQAVLAQSVITGKVTGAEDSDPLPGVSIVVEGSNRGTTTDLDGNFTIQANSEDVLQFSYIGFITQSITVGSQSTINVVLEPDMQQLEEVVVTAFGLEKEKKALGYSVTQVSGKEFTESRTINLGSALSGKVAGVNVSPPSTGAAGSSRVVIRGGSSLGGNDQPLYVINGVPMDNSNLGSASMWGGNDNGDGMSSINPDDIESISVLKGATASALYGSRASNGVILITTKTGTSRKGVGVSFNSNFTLDRVNDMTDFQTEFGHGINGNKPTNVDVALQGGSQSWGGRLDGSNVIQFDGVERPYSDNGEGLNDFYRTGYTLTNTLGLSGGNENFNFRVSASDLQNEDVMPNSGFKRRMLNTNLGGKFGKLSTKISAQYSKETAENRPRLSDSPGNANFAVLVMPNTISFEDLKGPTSKLGANEDGVELQHNQEIYTQNPYWAAYQFERIDNKDRILGNASLKYDITDWLYIQGRLGTDIISGEYRAVEGYGTAYKSTGSVNNTILKVREDNADLLIGASKQFGEIGVDVLVGGNRMRRSYESTRIGGDNLSIPFFHSVTNVENQTYTYSLSEKGINSIFGSANFSYKGFLFLNVTGRQDQFSTLSPDDNSVFYPSVGLSYVLSDMVELPAAFTFAKLRAAWAQVGGGDPDPYSITQTYSIQTTHGDAVLGDITNSSIPNSQLSPFLTTEVELGFDVRFLNNRLGFDFTYYDRTTKDDILQTSISTTSGFGTTYINVGELTNKGVELMINATPVQTMDFTWDLTLNLANNTSEVKSLGIDANGDPISYVDLGNSRLQQESIRNYVGQPVGVIAGYKQQVINGQKVYDENGYAVRGDYEILGQGRQPFSAGLSNTFRYKNFKLDFLIDMRSGGSLMSGTNVVAYQRGLHQETLVGRETGLTVTGVDANGDALQVEVAPENIDDYYSYYSRITDNFVYDASFAKLRQLAIGYSLPKSLLSNTPIQTASLSFVGRNLLLLWSNIPNIDPESAYSSAAGTQGLEYFAMPATRNFGFNLSLTF
ncbi:MAG: SusC/RagA family protein [Thalassobius sp.]|nr:SusC/RagA family protein [Thalassovita sp.]